MRSADRVRAAARDEAARHLGRCTLASALLALLVGLLVSAQGCKGKGDVAFDIALPSDLVQTTTWFEVGAFRDTTCGAVRPMLGNGVPDGAAKRVAFARSAPATPRIGDLATGAYAFVAVAKGTDCRVLATGCVEAEMGKDDTVAIAMNGVDPPSGACGLGAACQAARCVPANDNADPSVGAQCSLELLGAGPLANAEGGSGTLVSAPAIAATPSGFVIAYREVDPSGGSARVTVLPIDPAGGALDPTRPLLKGRCGTAEESDGIGLIMNGVDGNIVMSRAGCGATPALELLSFKSKPEVTIDPSFVSSPSTAQRLTLSDGHVAATRQGGSVVAFVQDGVSRISTVQPTGPGAGIVKPTGTFGFSEGVTGAWVAASDRVLAVLAAAPPGSAPPVGDAGADAEAGAGPGEATSPQLALVMAPASTSADQFAAEGQPRPPITFAGAWGGVAALGARVLVMSDGGNSPSRSITYRAFDLDKTAESDRNGFAIPGAGTPTTGDLTTQGDRVYFAVLKPGSVSLHVFANASTTLTPLREVLFAKQPRIPSVSIVRDGRVAVAATASRVAVAWTTGKTLKNNDSTGGYAVFACTP